MCGQNDANVYRRITLFWLTVWLLLCVVRECFDLLGKLWALVVFDLVQILTLCSAIFALAPQHRRKHRRCHSLSLALFALFALAYNIALLLWWCTELLATENGEKEKMLAFGLPFGHSFFLRHSPLCTAHFNLTSHRWQQSGNCPVPYNYLEGLQCIVHAFLAFGTFLLAVALWRDSPANSNNNSFEEDFEQCKTPAIMAAYSKVPLPNGQVMGMGGSIVDEIGYSAGSGFGKQAASIVGSDTTTVVLPNGIVAIPPIRRSFPRQKKQQQPERSGQNSSERRRKQFHQPTEHYSSLSTAECASLSAARAAIAKSISAHSSSDDSSSNGPTRGRLFSPYHSRPLPNQREGGCRSSLRTFGSLQNNVANGMNPLDENASSFQTAHQSPPIPALLRGIRERASTNPGITSAMTSLVSFNPKAGAGQLIQVREHRRTSDDYEVEIGDAIGGTMKEENADLFCQPSSSGKLRAANSLDSIPSQDAPILNLRELDFSSGDFNKQSAAPLPPTTPIPETPPTLGNGTAGLPLLRQRVFPTMPTNFATPQNSTSMDFETKPSEQQQYIRTESAYLLPSGSTPTRHGMHVDFHKIHNNFNGKQQEQNNASVSGYLPATVGPGNWPQSSMNCAGASFYDTFVGSGPQDASTSFPIQPGACPRTGTVQLGAASAIRLSRSDLSVPNGESGRHRLSAQLMGQLV